VHAQPGADVDPGDASTHDEDVDIEGPGVRW
jgi:hypothetical protein